MEKKTIEDGKTIAIISYFTWVGTLIAYVLNNDKKNPFASFHIRQALGLSIIAIISYFAQKLIGSSIFWILSLALTIFRIIGLIGALQGKEEKIPLFGDILQEKLKDIG